MVVRVHSSALGVRRRRARPGRVAGCQRLAAIEHLGWFRALPVHEHDELGVVCEERLLSFGIASVGAMSVGIPQLADREAVGLLSR